MVLGRGVGVLDIRWRCFICDRAQFGFSGAVFVASSVLLAAADPIVKHKTERSHYYRVCVFFAMCGVSYLSSAQELPRER